MHDQITQSTSYNAEITSLASKAGDDQATSEMTIASSTTDVEPGRLQRSPNPVAATPPTYVPSQPALPTTATFSSPSFVGSGVQRQETTRPARMVSLSGFEGPFYYLPPGVNPAGDVGQIKKLPPQKGKKSYQCPGCDLVFDRLSALKQHCLSHTGERPHGCDKCGRRFSVSSNLRRHLRTCKAEKQSQQGQETGSLSSTPNHQQRSSSVDEESDGNFGYEGGLQVESPRRRSYSPSNDGSYPISPPFPPRITLPMPNPFYDMEGRVITTLSTSTASTTSPWIETPQETQESHYFGRRISITSPPSLVHLPETMAESHDGIFDPRFDTHPLHSQSQAASQSHAHLQSQDQHLPGSSLSGPHHQNPSLPSSMMMHPQDYQDFYYSS